MLPLKWFAVGNKMEAGKVKPRNGYGDELGTGENFSYGNHMNLNLRNDQANKVNAPLSAGPLRDGRIRRHCVILLQAL